jgi:Uma2 family endonuclease
MKVMAKHKIIAPPRTALAVFEMLPEGTLAEVINNTIYMSPAPLFYHQEIVSNLISVINSYVRENDLGKAVASPIDVGIIKDGKVKGSVDIAIEVLSGKKDFDLVIKKAVYERFGVKEYFVVNPTTKEVNSFYLEGKKYQPQLVKIGKLKSKLLKKVFIF